MCDVKQDESLCRWCDARCLQVHPAADPGLCQRCSCTFAGYRAFVAMQARARLAEIDRLPLSRFWRLLPDLRRLRRLVADADAFERRNARRVGVK